MEARHLLYAYVTVWVIQGGYALWIAYQWKKTRKSTPTEPIDSTKGSEEF